MKVLLNSAENDRGSFARDAIRPINSKPTSSTSPCFNRVRSSWDNGRLPLAVPECFAETHSWIRLKRDEGDWIQIDGGMVMKIKGQRDLDECDRYVWRARCASRWENVIVSQFHVPHTHRQSHAHLVSLKLRGVKLHWRHDPDLITLDLSTVLMNHHCRCMSVYGIFSSSVLPLPDIIKPVYKWFAWSTLLS